MPQLSNLGQQIPKTSMAEVELGEEISNVQAGDERRGSCASSILPWCWSLTLRWESHRHGSSLHFSRKNSAGCLARNNTEYQPPLRAHRREEREETQMRNSRGEERRVVKMVSHRQGARMKGFQLVLFLKLLYASME